MSIDINLVTKKTSEGSRDERLKKIKVISFSALIITALLSIILFLVNLRFSVNYVKNQQNKLIQELSTYDEAASKIFLLNQRVTDITSIISQRKKYHEKTELIFQEMPSVISIQEYKIDNSSAAMTITSRSLLDMNNYINYLLKLSKSRKINSVTLNQLTSGPDGYTVALTIN
jgi:predicted PurR-regulated permease PerM